MKNIWFVVLTLLLLVFISGQVKAIEWVHVSTSATQSKVYFEMDSIERNQSSIKLWVKVIEKTPKTLNKKQYHESLLKMQINCSTNAVGILRSTLYTKAGVHVKTEYPIYVEHELAPDSVLYDSVILLCMAKV